MSKIDFYLRGKVVYNFFSIPVDYDGDGSSIVDIFLWIMWVSGMFEI
jgi:hypothetical protein